jgi:hypothetical protein
MRIGLVVSQPAERLDLVPVHLLAEAGMWAVFLRCFEDEVRWRAPAIDGFARAAAASGLRVFLVPAGYGGLFSPEQHPGSLFLQAHPHTRQLDTRGRRVPKACPNHPAYLEWLTSALRSLAWLVDADGFLWEEPGFYYLRGVWGCRCGYCQELYAGRQEGPMPLELSHSVAMFRQQVVAELVATVSAAVKSVDAKLASLVMPTPAPQIGAVPTGNENWRLLASTQGVDGLALTWPPGPPSAPLTGAVAFQDSARAWLPPKTLVLLRLVCPPNLTELDITLRQLAQARVPAVVLEVPHPLAGDLTPSARAVLDIVRVVA